MTLPLGIWDSIAGLPAHPLIVHAAVVIGPLTALAVLVLQFKQSWRITFRWLTTLGAALAILATWAAKESGEALAATVGVPERHQQLGSTYLIAVAALAVSAPIWLVLERRLADAKDQPVSTVPTVIMQIVSALAAVGVLVGAVLTGHSGAEAVWGANGAAHSQQVPGQESADTNDSEAADDLADATTTPSDGTSSDPAASASHLPTYTLAEVEQHAGETSCWAAVNGGVYDLTEWIAQHPGGRQRILNLCGTDATSAFTAQHERNAIAQDRLAQLQIGELGE